jgi:poly-gamma-glutamate synthesis protein (capsule biosynthesis protein)
MFFEPVVGSVEELERMKRTFQTVLGFLVGASILLAGCNPPQVPPAATPVVAAATVEQTATSQPRLPDSTAEPPALTRLWYEDSVPAAIRQAAILPVGVRLAARREEASLIVGVERKDAQTRWVYALVAAFPTVTDSVPLVDLLDVWKGRPGAEYAAHPLRVAKGTYAAFEALWGPSSPDTVKIVEPEGMIEQAWKESGALYLIPFEELEPRWKVLRVEGMSPLDKVFDLEQYPLAVPFAATGGPQAASVVFPASNRDPDKMTVILMTGVTALVRATGFKMENAGMTFPGKDILPWFQSADLRHISNEIAFSPDCPPANPYQTSLMFCSRPEYAELLDYVGANVIELTGNHQMDWGYKAFEYSLNLYQERGWPYYAAGYNEEDARKPLLLEDHGNKIAFIGCNPSGPELVWATELNPGVAKCDFEWMQAEIRKLRADGYQVIATMQYFEYYTPDPRPWQVEDFRGLAEAGAVIVSGSQAHKPQAFDFSGSSFIHYGVGNLFFDQMDIPVVGTRREFLDRHVIYDGRYISTELLTAMLEDYARPRPMTLAERVPLLQEMFEESGWLPKTE